MANLDFMAHNFNTTFCAGAFAKFLKFYTDIILTMRLKCSEKEDIFAI